MKNSFHRVNLILNPHQHKICPCMWQQKF